MVRQVQTASAAAPLENVAHSKTLKETGSKQMSKVWWINGAFVILAHLIGVLSLVVHRPDPRTWLLTLVLWQLANLG